jgi:hypothetical protein
MYYDYFLGRFYIDYDLRIPQDITDTESELNYLSENENRPSKKQNVNSEDETKSLLRSLSDIHSKLETINSRLESSNSSSESNIHNSICRNFASRRSMYEVSIEPEAEVLLRKRRITEFEYLS